MRPLNPLVIITSISHRIKRLFDVVMMFDDMDYLSCCIPVVRKALDEIPALKQGWNCKFKFVSYLTSTLSDCAGLYKSVCLVTINPINTAQPLKHRDRMVTF